MIEILPDTEHNQDDFKLEPELVEALWNMEESHFWHMARNRWILRALRAMAPPPPARVLEVGCGSGIVSRFLQQRGYRVTGVDTAEPLVRKAHGRCPEATFIAGDVTKLPPAHRGPYDIIGLFDVLEHLAEPADLLRSSVAWARPGATVAITVPAMQREFSLVDELGGHKKRYDPGETTRLFEDSGLEPVGEFSTFRATRWIQRLFRQRIAGKSRDQLTEAEKNRVLKQNLQVPAGPVNLTLGVLCDLERVLGFRFSKGKVGGTALAIARVPA